MSFGYSKNTVKPVLPSGDVIQDVVSDSGNQAAWDVDIVELFNALYDLSGGLTLSVKEYNFIIKATNTGLMLTDKYRLKATVAVSGGGDLKLAYVTADSLLVCPLRLLGLSAFSCLG